MLDIELSYGLENLHLPHILVARADEEIDTSHIPEMLSLYGVCCLQLYNHIVEEAPYKECANETCRRLFVRQRGRAEHGQYRTIGVKYCSRDCARAQAQREHRRRKRNAQTTTAD